jgi:hypothetical protein
MSGSCVDGNEPSGCIKGGECTDFQLLKNDSVQWSSLCHLMSRMDFVDNSFASG